MSLAADLERLLSASTSPPNPAAWAASTAAGIAAEDLLATLRLDQQRRWRTPEPWPAELYLQQLSPLPDGINWQLELVVGEWLARPAENPLTTAELQRRFPELTEFSAAFTSIPLSGESFHSLDVLTKQLDGLHEQGIDVPLSEFLLALLPPNERTAGFLHLLSSELQRQQERGLTIVPQDWFERFPGYIPQIQQLLSGHAIAQTELSTAQHTPTIVPQQPAAELPAIRFRSTHSRNAERYRIECVLGRGAFGEVYKGFDEELRRHVAIKIPTAKWLQDPRHAEQYLAEARVVAGLEHAHIVPVYDVDISENGSICVVSKFVDGGTLKNRLLHAPLNPRAAVEMLIPIAQALHYAHSKGIIHRDVKPENILIDSASGSPFITDFGLAIREEDELASRQLAGTPAYMSPEQARGEAHRLDGRSDVFSLGVVLYEMLCQIRPFRGNSIREVLDAVISNTPDPPRQHQPSLPAELERICLKALANRVSDRYSSAAELACDLHHWLNSGSPETSPPQTIAVRPQGLRSFTADEADFFPELLPGVRNREGIPQSIDFWKLRIEQPDPQKTFTVGVMMGPSGCGKSSLVKAGLLPKLATDVVAIYLEATPHDTEQRLCTALRRRLPELPHNASLPELLTLIRRNPGRKVAIFIDQFEQWLHTHIPSPQSELVSALRQCNATRLQAVLMVRDDFAMATARFMDALDVRMVQAENYATVDLFDLQHAATVLVRFGQAFGQLPMQGELSAEQRQFVDQVVQSLQQQGRVFSVRLTLFADMVRARPWNLSTLREIGGAAGIGVAFLNETFDSPRGNPRHRQHADACRRILRKLLPAVDTEIKGASRTASELQMATGLTDAPDLFADVIRILDSELRLITPSETRSDSSSNERSWQLTHDFLVPSLRTWLSQKQIETRQGRAELLLETRTAVWQSRQENRQLPSLFEYLRIRFLVGTESWTVPQQEMMALAKRRHVLRISILSAAILVLTLGIRSFLAAQQVRELAKALQTANPDQLGVLLVQADGYGKSLDPLLRPLIRLADEPDAPPELQTAALAARLVLVKHDKSQLPLLTEALLNEDLRSVAPIRDRLNQYADELRPTLLKLLRNELEPGARRFRAALGLALFRSELPSEQFTETDLQFIAAELVKSFSEYQPQLRTLLRPIGPQLLPALDKLFDDEATSAEQQINATMALVEFADDEGELLAQLLIRANQRQTEILFPKLSGLRSGPVRDGLMALIREQPAETLGQRERIRLGQRRANAAIALLRQGERDSWFNALRITDDPESLSQFVNRCRNWGVTPQELLESLEKNLALRPAAADKEKWVEARITYGLLLALGNYSLEQLPEASREPLLKRLQGLYEQDPSAAVHSASGWLLRHWGLADAVDRLDQTEVPYDASGHREWFRWRVAVSKRTEGSPDEPAPAGPKQTFSLTFLVIPAGTYRLGSPAAPGAELDRQLKEDQRTVRITRPVAICDRELSQDLFELYDGGTLRNQASKLLGWNLKSNDAVTGVTWYELVNFCRWLTRERFGDAEEWQCFADPRNLPLDAGKNPVITELLTDRCGFRMPTESEWEIAARAGQRTAWTFGSDPSLLGDYAWYVTNSAKRPQATGVKQPTIGGAFDLQGNAHEWTYDLSGASEEGALLIDPQGATEGQFRTFRGGNWGLAPAECRLAFRRSNIGSLRDTGGGFRLALSPTGKSPEPQSQPTSENR